ncbi:MAG TPA: SxtJ family membrane protein [Magnetospirillum sp.]|nr:SxtJ family membrane protein [Magnetospirillum sp.]
MVDKNSPVNELQAHSGPVKMGSERSFGLVFTAFFALVALWPLKSGGEVRLWAAGAATAFLLAALVAPRALRPLNLAWFKLGMILHRVMTPVMMGLLFFLTVTPVGLLMRAFGKDPMRLKRDGKAQTYWVTRTPPGPAPDSMKTQF